MRPVLKAALPSPPPSTAAAAPRDRVQPLLRSLCAGATDAELPAATAGLLAPAAHVRAAALIALPHVPSLAEGVPPGGPPLATLHLARFDPSEANAEGAAALWDDAGCELPTGPGSAWFVEALAGHLASPHADVRAAAAAALAVAVDAEPGRVGDAVGAVIGLYDSGLDEAARAAAAAAAAAEFAAAPIAVGKKAGGGGGGKGFGLEEEERKLQVRLGGRGCAAAAAAAAAARRRLC
jgi:hypothetical protein